jgi:hypothetical protein
VSPEATLPSRVAPCVSAEALQGVWEPNAGLGAENDTAPPWEAVVIYRKVDTLWSRDWFWRFSVPIRSLISHLNLCGNGNLFHIRSVVE